MGLKSQIVKFVNSMLPKSELSKSDGFYIYGANNNFPTELLYAVSDSGTATACVHKLKTFIKSDGFTDVTISKIKMNDEQSADDLLDEIAYSISLYDGFALNILYKLDGSIGSIYVLPFDKIRKNEDGTFTYNKTFGTKAYKKADAKKYPAYNPNLPTEERIEVIRYQLDEFDEQLGEILYTYFGSPYNEYYPVPSWSAGIDDVNSDAALTKLEHRNITRGFRPNVIISTVGEIDDYNRDDFGKTDADYFDENLREFTGEDASTILHLQAESKEGLPSVTLYPLAEMLDGVDNATDRVARKVCRHFNVPPVLIGLTMPEGLGNTQAMANAMKLFNQVVLPYQSLISSTFEMLFPQYTWEISTTNIIDYIPDEVLSVLTNDEKRALGGYAPLPATGTTGQVTLAEKLGVGGTQSLVSIIADPNLTPEQKASTLQILFGLTYEDANKLVFGKQASGLSAEEQKIIDFLSSGEVGVSTENLILDEEENKKGERVFSLKKKSINNAIDPNTPFYIYSGPNDDKTRPFCKALLKLNKLFSLEDIDRLSIYVGYDVELYFGGFNCRHKWKRARIKGKLQKGFEPDTPNLRETKKVAVEQSDSMQEYFPL